MFAGNALTAGRQLPLTGSACLGCRLERRHLLVPQTPSTVGWVLLEHPGPWGQRRAADSELVAPRLRAAGERHRLSLALIRRYGQRNRRRSRDRGTTTAFLVGLNGSERFIEELTLADQEDISQTVLERLAEGRPSGHGRLRHDPLYLVCTHGRVDAACARLGRPLAQALSAATPGDVWESTHVGGCRFAANVVCLPAGIYYGYISPGDVGEIVAATRAGRIATAWYRGRAGLPAPGQTADAFLRRAIGLADVEAITLVHARADSEGYHHVEFTSDWAKYRVLLRARPAAAHTATCAFWSSAQTSELQIISVIETRHRG